MFPELFQNLEIQIGKLADPFCHKIYIPVTTPIFQFHVWILNNFLGSRYWIWTVFKSGQSTPAG